MSIHIDETQMRGLDEVILQEVIMEYIKKIKPRIVMISTPNRPGSLFCELEEANK